MSTGVLENSSIGSIESYRVLNRIIYGVQFLVSSLGVYIEVYRILKKRLQSSLWSSLTGVPRLLYCLSLSSLAIQFFRGLHKVPQNSAGMSTELSMDFSIECSIEVYLKLSIESPLEFSMELSVEVF